MGNETSQGPNGGTTTFDDRLAALNCGGSRPQIKEGTIKKLEYSSGVGDEQVPKDLTREDLQRIALTRGFPARTRGILWPKLIVDDCKDLGMDVPALAAAFKEPLADGAVGASLKETIEVDLVRAHFMRETVGPVAFEAMLNALRRVLTKFGARNTDVGYCQGMDRLAATLLVYVGETECCLGLTMIVDCLLRAYHSNGLLGVRIDSQVMEHQLRDRWPALVDKIEALGQTVPYFTNKWFITVFVCYLPPDVVHRVWDIFLAHGSNSITACSVLIAVSMAIFALAKPLIMDRCADIEMLERIMNKDVHALIVEDEKKFWRIVEHELADVQRRSLTVLRSVTVEASNPFHSPTHASSASSNSLSSAGSGPSPLGGSGFFDGFSAKRSDDTASGGASSTEDLSAVAAAANGGGGGAAAGGEGDHEGKEDGQAPPQ